MTKSPKPSTPLSEPFIPRHKACDFFGGVDVTTLDNWVALGVLPPALKITARSVGWRASVLEAVLENAAVKGSV